MNQNKALWEKGDFTRISETMVDSGAELVARLGLNRGKILDLGCGNGTTAIPAAKLGADVLGVDIAANLIEAAKKRAIAEGVPNCRFQLGDATQLHELHDDTFDVVISIFGAMFAPEPLQVAKEMVRVTRKGGKIIMGNWIPGDPTLVAQILKISSAYTPAPPEGFISPMLWGVEEQVINRFTAAGIASDNISFSKETFMFRANFSPKAFVERFKNFYGPTMNAFEAAEKTGKALHLQQELEQLFETENISGNDEQLKIPANYLLVTVSK